MAQGQESAMHFWGPFSALLVYRKQNTVVHSTKEELYVDGDIYETLNYVFDKLKAMYENRETSQWHELKKELLEYINQRTIGNVESDIMQLLSQNEYTVQQIAAKTGLSSGRVAYALKRLEAAGLVVYSVSGSRRFWRKLTN